MVKYSWLKYQLFDTNSVILNHEGTLYTTNIDTYSIF